MPVSYALDITGVSSNNLVVDELHSVNESQFRDYYFLIPNLAPFYVDNFTLSLVGGGTDRLLTEDVDYSFTLPYVTGTRTTGKQMYGGVTLHNLSMNGLLKMSYQTIGGDQVVDKLTVMSYLADKAYNPRTTIWDNITNLPTAFPPVPHYQDYDDFKGQEDLVFKLGEIRDAILANSSLTSVKIQEFLDEFLSGTSAVYVRRVGDTMTGPLTLSGQPTAPNHAATKQFVEQTTISEATVSTILENYVTNTILQENMDEKLSLTGGRMTGPIKLANDPVVGEDAIRKAYLDGVVSGFTTTMNAMQVAINNINSVMATKSYVDDLIAQVMIKANTVGLQRS